MEIVLVFIVVAALALYIIIGYKGNKDSKNQPDQIKNKPDRSDG